MLPIVNHEGIVIPLDRSNVDTDAIIPKQFLKSIKKSGFGPNLFDEWRYLDQGEPGKESVSRKPNPEFVLNKPQYVKGTVLLTRENFGCGSSREHAPWALLDYGIRIILAPSFADIFYGNCFKNGILPIVISKDLTNILFDKAQSAEGLKLLIDLVVKADVPSPAHVIALTPGNVVSFSIFCCEGSCTMKRELGIGHEFPTLAHPTRSETA